MSIFGLLLINFVFKNFILFGKKWTSMFIVSFTGVLAGITIFFISKLYGALFIKISIVALFFFIIINSVLKWNYNFQKYAVSLVVVFFILFAVYEGYYGQKIFSKFGDQVSFFSTFLVTEQNFFLATLRIQSIFLPTHSLHGQALVFSLRLRYCQTLFFLGVLWQSFITMD